MDSDYEKINKFNSKKSNLDVGIALFGGAGASVAELSRFAHKYYPEITDTLSNLVETYILYGKGAFQAVLYGSLINMVLSERKSRKGFETRNKEESIKKDHSIVASGATMITGLAWEAYSLFVGNFQGIKSTHYDWQDVGFYAVGVGFLIGVAKLAENTFIKPPTLNKSENSHLKFSAP